MAQLDDIVTITLRLPTSTEEWADELLAECEGTEVERLDDGLFATYSVGGNCNGITNLRMWLSDVEEAMTEGNIDPMSFTVEVTSKASDGR